MNTARSLSLALCIMSAPLAAAQATAQATPTAAPSAKPVRATKQDSRAAANLNTFTKIGLGVSAASLVSGFALRSDRLMGAGLGGLGGIGTGILQKNIHWLIAWFGEGLTRGIIAGKLCTQNPKDMEVSDEELANPSDWNSKLMFKNPNLTNEEKFKIIANNKAYGPIANAGSIASWITYLAYRYLEKKAEQA